MGLRQITEGINSIATRMLPQGLGLGGLLGEGWLQAGNTVQENPDHKLDCSHEPPHQSCKVHASAPG